MYTSDLELTLLERNLGWRACVSEQLQRFVQKDNDVFSNEIAEFDERQKRILPAQHVRISLSLSLPPHSISQLGLW